MYKISRRMLLSLITLSFLFAFSNQIVTGMAYSENQLPAINVKVTAAENRVAASNNGIGSPFAIANTAIIERSPAVAYCSGGYYLVVYESNSDTIYGQFVNLFGGVIGSRFEIFSWETVYSPKIACDWYNQQFIVIWSVYEWVSSQWTYNVMAQAVRGSYNASGSNLIGSPISVSDDDDQHEMSPSVACNINVSSCLVAFQYGGITSNDIYAQRVAVGHTGLSLDGDRFPVANSIASEVNPDVVWGGQEFLVGYSQYYISTASHYRIGYHQIYDTEQGPGAEERKNSLGSWLIPPGYSWGEYDDNQEYVSLAYNNNSHDYIATFSFKGNSLIMVLFTSGAMGNPPIEVTNSFKGNTAVTFCDGPENFKSIHSEFLIPYVTALNTSIYSLSYVQSKNTLDKRISDMWTGVIGIYDTTIYQPMDVDIAGNFATENYLVVWVVDTPTDDDIYGQFIRPISDTNLPMIVR